MAIKKLSIRYFWSKRLKKDVFEVACGTGSGLSMINNVANTLLLQIYKMSLCICKNTIK